MCGITGFCLKSDRYKNFEWLDDFVDQLLLGIEIRGTDATGIIQQTHDHKVFLQKQAVEATKFVAKRRKLDKDCSFILGHTRLTTKGSPSNFHNNHPVHYNSTFVTHNGSIYNDDKLFEEEKLARNAEVDTEIIAALLDKYGFDNAPEAINKLQGGFAVAAVNPHKNPGKILLFKNTSWPIESWENDDIFIWSSLSSAIREALPLLDLDKDKDGNARTLLSGDLTTLDSVNGTVATERDAFDFSSFRKTGHQTHNRLNWDGDEWEDGEWAYCGTIHVPSSSQTRLEATKKAQEEKEKKIARSAEVPDLRTRVKELSESHVITWTQQEQMTDEQREKHDGKWEFCPSCRRAIAAFCYEIHPEHGLICVDCMSVLAADKYNISIELIDEIETWAKLESEVHYNILSRVGRDVGLKDFAIDYLLYRATQDSVKNKDGMDALWDLCQNLYNEYEEECWNEILDASSENEDETEDDDVSADIINLAHEKSKRRMGVTIEMHEQSDIQCRLCRKKAHYFINDWAWCKYHFVHCHTRKCKKTPRGVTREGQMKCHEHFRGLKGIQFSKELHREFFASL